MCYVIGCQKSWFSLSLFFLFLYFLWCGLSCFSCVQLFATQWTVAHQAPLSMGFFRQESWSELPCPPSGDLPNPGIEPGSPTLQADSLPSEPRKALQKQLTPLQLGQNSNLQSSDIPLKTREIIKKKKSIWLWIYSEYLHMIYKARAKGRTT